ncbi:MAG: hypothetical protein LBC55_05780 [Desulfovibrio sp.]|jgi:hypothetical protein|nr:hypothetical protein [Desulfovibrio sp.]
MTQTLKELYGDVYTYQFVGLIGNIALAHRVLFWSVKEENAESGDKAKLCFCWGKYNALNYTPQEWLEHVDRCREDGRVTWKTPEEIGEMTRTEFVLFLAETASR